MKYRLTIKMSLMILVGVIYGLSPVLVVMACWFVYKASTKYLKHK